MGGSPLEAATKEQAVARYERLWDPYAFADPKAYVTVRDGLEGVVLAGPHLVPVAGLAPGYAEMFDAALEDEHGRLPHERPRLRVIDGGPDATPVVPLHAPALERVA